MEKALTVVFWSFNGQQTAVNYFSIQEFDRGAERISFGADDVKDGRVLLSPGTSGRRE